MNQQQYSPRLALDAARKAQEVQTMQTQKTGKTETRQISYAALLETVQARISEDQNFKDILASALQESNKQGVAHYQLIAALRALVSKLTTMDIKAIESTVERLLQDMTGFGLLTPYIEDPLVEEININGPGKEQIRITDKRYPKGVKLIDGFPDAQTVMDMVKRMVRMGGTTIDQSNPRVDSYMQDGIRISAMIYPVIRADKGAVASIRKQTQSTITRNDLILSQAGMPEEYELMELCTQNQISGAIVGATGSGKTTLLNYLLTDYAKSLNMEPRIYIIEESRELQLPPEADVIYTAVVGGQNEVTAQDLLKSALRFHPDLISCAEMRGEEAMNAMSAAQTGHVVWSTFHADDGKDAYQRLLTMCKMSGTDLSEHLLMRNLVSAFPIIVSTKQMKDSTRKITGIFEATGVDGVGVVGHYIYKLQVTGMEYDEGGNVQKVHGRHCRVGDLSDRLAQKIFDNCGQLEKVRKFARPDWIPEKIETNTLLQAGRSTAEF